MAYAVEEFDDDLAVARLAWLARDDRAALDQACDVCLSYTDVDLGIHARAIGLLARVLYPDLPADPPSATVRPGLGLGPQPGAVATRPAGRPAAHTAGRRS
jgi:hypothetical protein